MTAAPLNLEIGGDNSQRVFVLRGELDVSTASQLGGALRNACTKGAQEIVLDLREVEFMDSTGLRMLLLGRDVCSEHGCELFIDPTLPLPLKRLFTLTRAGEHLDFKAPHEGIPRARGTPREEATS